MDLPTQGSTVASPVISAQTYSYEEGELSTMPLEIGILLCKMNADSSDDC